MTREKIKQIRKKYQIDYSHSGWNIMVDNWMSVEVWQAVKGELPPNNLTEEEILEVSVDVPMKFLDNTKLHKKLQKEDNQKFIAMFATAKRMLYRGLELNENHSKTPKIETNA